MKRLTTTPAGRGQVLNAGTNMPWFDRDMSRDRRLTFHLRV